MYEMTIRLMTRPPPSTSNGSGKYHHGPPRERSGSKLFRLDDPRFQRHHRLTMTVDHPDSHDLRPFTMTVTFGEPVARRGRRDFLITNAEIDVSGSEDSLTIQPSSGTATIGFNEGPGMDATDFFGQWRQCNLSWGIPGSGDSTGWTMSVDHQTAMTCGPSP